MKRILIVTHFFMISSICCATQELAPHGTHLSLGELSSSPIIYLSFESGPRAVVTLNEPDPYLDRQFMRFGKGPITILLGTSTAGKTTIINHRLQNNKDLLNCGLDQCFEYMFNCFLSYRYPSHYKRITEATGQSLAKLLGDRKDTIKFKEQIPEDKQIKVMKSLECLNKTRRNLPAAIGDWLVNCFFERIITLSQRNQTLILDTVNIPTTLELYKRHFHAPIQVQLVFVPFRELSRRMVIRNESAVQRGEGSDTRPQFPLSQYAHLYRPIQTAEETVLETLAREEVLEEMNRHRVDQQKQLKILHALGFTSPNITKVAITSRFQHYHQLIRN